LTEIFINIITPCSRPRNLRKLAKSINIPKENYRWIVICDRKFYPFFGYIPSNCEIYCHKNLSSISGNAQRNFALQKVGKGYVYFNDDDTVIHPELWENVKSRNEDFIYFKQQFNNAPRFSEEVKVGNIDSHTFLVSIEIVSYLKWELGIYEADGLFAMECYARAKTKIFIDKVLSVYNALRPS
jgi:hypothetical protein